MMDLAATYSTRWPQLLLDRTWTVLSSLRNHLENCRDRIIFKLQNLNNLSLVRVFFPKNLRKVISKHAKFSQV